MGKVTEQMNTEIAQLAKADTLEIGEDHPQYKSGEPSYGMAILKCSGKLDGVGLIGELRRMNSRLRAERDEERERCEELEAERNRHIEMRHVTSKHWLQAARERDESRSHCEKLEDEIATFKAERQRLHGDVIVELSRRDSCEKLEAERDEMQLQMWAAQYCVEEIEKERDEAREWANRRTRVANELLAELESTCKELCYHKREGLDWLRWGQEMEKILKGLRAEARNKALDEADKAAYHAMNERWGELIGIGETLHVRTAITVLKEKV